MESETVLIDAGALQLAGLTRAVIPPVDDVFLLTPPPVESKERFLPKEIQKRFGGHWVTEEICEPEHWPFRRSDGERKRRGKQAHALPRVGTVEELVYLGDWCGASAFQIQHARAMWEGGLESKATRLVLCGRLGRQVTCIDETHCGHSFFLLYRCGNRYCSACMGAVFQALFNDLHKRLVPVVQRLVPHWPVEGRRPWRVIAKVDFTVPNQGRMPEPEIVRQFNKDIRKFFRRLARQMGWNNDQWGAAWCIEFGPGNTNLHAHGVYAGPWLPQKKRELSELWSEVRAERSFVSVKAARSFEHALRHAIKYPAAKWKYVNSSPERLTSLEVAFNGIRRVHTVGAFYNPPRTEEQLANSVGLGTCPDCGSMLGESMGWQWKPVADFQRGGVRELDAARREAGRTRVFGTVRPP